MDLNQIANLLPEFLQNFTGKNSKNLPAILSAIGSTGMLEGFMGEKYAKYLPLLPLITKFSSEGFKGLLSDADTITSLLALFTDGDGQFGGPEILKSLSPQTVASLLPLIVGVFKKEDVTAQTDSMPTALPAALPSTDNTYRQPTNPLAPISEFAGKDVIYMLTRYLSHNYA